MAPWPPFGSAPAWGVYYQEVYGDVLTLAPRRKKFSPVGVTPDATNVYSESSPCNF